MRKKAHHEEHENAERWLLTYADLITLLLGLFVVLYSTAQQDTEKFRKAMRAMVKVLNPTSETSMMGNNKEFSIVIGKGEGEEKKEEEVCKDKNLEELKKEIEKAEGSGKGINTRMSKDGLIIDMEEHLLFDTGKTDFKEGAFEVLNRVSDYLKKVPNKIKIGGHTDNVPIHNSNFPSNWHLALRRAEKTSEYFIFKRNMDLKRFVIEAYADTVPVADNSKEEGRKKNRRVEVLVLKEEAVEDNKNEKSNPELKNDSEKKNGH
ncbi:MAG: OmpA/MotB family protein [Elusimicrobiales bacterium]|nr:OmpA family protein [Elusimicrobiales bacterium]